MILVRKKDDNPLLIFKTSKWMTRAQNTGNLLFVFFFGGVKLKILSADKLLYSLVHQYDFVVIPDDQMTAGNMVPWLQ